MDLSHHRLGRLQGRWGGSIVTRGRWDPEGFAAQTPQFVAGVENGMVQFGYAGQRTADMSVGIRVEDARWLYRYLGRITDQQLRDALTASGASQEDAESFAASLRERISQIGRAGGESQVPHAAKIKQENGTKGVIPLEN